MFTADTTWMKILPDGVERDIAARIREERSNEVINIHRPCNTGAMMVIFINYFWPSVVAGAQ